MKQIKKISTVFLFVCLVLSHTAIAQHRNGAEKPEGLVIAGKTGVSFLVTEVYRDFSGMVSEFSNTTGPYTGLEVSRYFTSALETGAGVSWSLLKGYNETPDFSAIGYQYYMKEPPNGAMQYNSRLYGPELFARYHFGRNIHRPRNLNFFMKAGAGVLFYESELFYSDRENNEVIFGKNSGKFKQYKMSNMVYIIGAGLNFVLSEFISLKAAANLNMVGYDFLDVVHNFDAAGNRQEVLGLFTDITAGVVIKLKGQEKTSSANRAKLYAGPHLPFSPL